MIALTLLLFTHPAVDGATLDRLGAIRPEIEIAADVAGLEPAVLAAVFVGETGARPLPEKPDGKHFGIAQMRLYFWRTWLAGQGWHPDDLDDPIWGDHHRGGGHGLPPLATWGAG